MCGWPSGTQPLSGPRGEDPDLQIGSMDMHSNDNGQTTLEAGLLELDRVNKDLVVLTSFGLRQEAIGAENTWLDQAVRVAMIPAGTMEAAAFKIKLLQGNLSGWALQASKANGLIGAAGLVMGAVAAEAHEWGLETETADACGAEQQAQVWAVDIDPGVLAAYRKNAKPRRLGPALKAYKTAVAGVDAMLARRKDDGLLADALRRSRDALLDAIAISTRNVAELERKQRAYLAYRDRVDHGRWLFAHGMSVAFQLDYSLLELPAAEIERLKAMFQNPWTSNDRPSSEEWARHSSTGSCRPRCPPRSRCAAGGPARSPGGPGAWPDSGRSRRFRLGPSWPSLLARPPSARAAADHEAGSRPDSRTGSAGSFG